ncbi:MAG TPA: FHA domain-containing protein, partial [Candidatus Omnitrophota bacterium]|nr:FHA domain-containing protein [Candidatus Omnitrophota bacterium]
LDPLNRTDIKAFRWVTPGEAAPIEWIDPERYRHVETHILGKTGPHIRDSLRLDAEEPYRGPVRLILGRDVSLVIYRGDDVPLVLAERAGVKTFSKNEFILFNENDPGHYYRLMQDQTFRVGRSPSSCREKETDEKEVSNDMVLGSDLVSRFHLSITVKENNLNIRDFGSLNGTRIKIFEDMEEHNSGFRKSVESFGIASVSGFVSREASGPVQEVVTVGEDVSGIKHIMDLENISARVRDRMRAVDAVFASQVSDEGLVGLIKEFRTGLIIMENGIRKGQYYRTYNTFGETMAEGEGVATPAEYAAYEAWKYAETFREERGPEPALKSAAKLMNILSSRGKKLYTGYGRNKKNEEVVGDIAQLGSLGSQLLWILENMPGRVMDNPYLYGIWLQSSRVGAGRGSSFEDGTMNMYASLFDMPKSVYLAVFLHEFGHAVYDGLEGGYFEGYGAIKKAHGVLARHGAFLGSEFFGGEKERINYQAFFNEFIAELNMLYFAQGNRLREHINNMKNADVRKAWLTAYKIFRDNIYGGREFVEHGENYLAIEDVKPDTEEPSPSSRGFSGLPNDVYSPAIRNAINSGEFTPVVFDNEFGLLHDFGPLGRKGKTVTPAEAAKLKAASSYIYREDLPILENFAANAVIIFIEGLDVAVEAEARAQGIAVPDNCVGSHYSFQRHQYYLDKKLLDDPALLAEHLHHEVQERQAVFTAHDISTKERAIISSGAARDAELTRKIKEAAKKAHEALIGVSAGGVGGVKPQLIREEPKGSQLLTEGAPRQLGWGTEVRVDLRKMVVNGSPIFYLSIYDRDASEGESPKFHMAVTLGSDETAAREVHDYFNNIGEENEEDLYNLCATESALSTVRQVLGGRLGLGAASEAERRFNAEIYPAHRKVFGDLPGSMQILFSKTGLSDRAIAFFKTDGLDFEGLMYDNKKGLPLFLDRYGIDFAVSHWDDLVELGLAAGKDAERAFGYGLVLFKIYLAKADPRFVENHWPLVMDLARQAGAGAWDLFGNWLGDLQDNFIGMKDIESNLRKLGNIRSELIAQAGENFSVTAGFRALVKELGYEFVTDKARWNDVKKFLGSGTNARMDLTDAIIAFKKIYGENSVRERFDGFLEFGINLGPELANCLRMMGRIKEELVMHGAENSRVNGFISDMAGQKDYFPLLIIGTLLARYVTFDPSERARGLRTIISEELESDDPYIAKRDRMINKLLHMVPELAEGVYFGGERIDADAMKLKLVNERRFKIPGYFDEYMDLFRKFVHQQKASFEKTHYRLDARQAGAWAYETTRDETVESLLARDRRDRDFSGHLAMHQTKNIELLESIITHGYLIPAAIFERLNADNLFEQKLKEGKVTGLIATEGVHFSIDGPVHYLDTPYAIVYPLEMLMENQAFTLDPLGERIDDWEVRGFSANPSHPSHQVPVANGIILVPDTVPDRARIDRIFEAMRNGMPGWRPPRVFYYQGFSTKEGLKQLRALYGLLDPADQVAISAMPKAIRKLGGDKFKNDSLGSGAVSLLSIQDVKDVNGVVRYGKLTDLSRLAEVRDFSVKLQNEAESILSEIVLGNITIEDTGSSMRGTYQERQAGFPDDFDLMVHVMGQVPGDAQLSEFAARFAESIASTRFGLGGIYGQETYRVKPESFISHRDGRSLVKLQVFRSVNEAVPILSIDVNFFNDERGADGIRYQRAFLENMKRILSGIPEKDRPAAEQHILSVIRNLKAIFKNNGVYSWAEGGLRGVGTEQLVMQLNGVQDQKGTPNPVNGSLDDLKRIFSEENALRTLEDAMFIGDRYAGLDGFRKNLPLWDIGNQDPVMLTARVDERGLMKLADVTAAVLASKQAEPAAPGAVSETADARWELEVTLNAGFPRLEEALRQAGIDADPQTLYKIIHAQTRDDLIRVIGSEEKLRIVVNKLSEGEKDVLGVPRYVAPEGAMLGDDTISLITQRQAVFHTGRVETIDVGPCVFVVIVNADTGEQFVAHIDANTLLDKGNNADIINRLSGWKNKRAFIGGGLKGLSIGIMNNALAFLKDADVGSSDISQYKLLRYRDGFMDISSVPVRLKDGTYSALVSEEVRSDRQLFKKEDHAKLMAGTPLIMPASADGMSRRDFLKGLIATTAAASLGRPDGRPSGSIQEKGPLPGPRLSTAAKELEKPVAVEIGIPDITMSSSDTPSQAAGFGEYM